MFIEEGATAEVRSYPEEPGLQRDHVRVAVRLRLEAAHYAARRRRRVYFPPVCYLCWATQCKTTSFKIL